MTQWVCIRYKMITRKHFASMVRPSLFFYRQAQILLLPFPQFLCSLYSCFWGKIEGKHKILGNRVAVPGSVLAEKGISIPQKRLLPKGERMPGQGPASLTKNPEGIDIPWVWRQQELPPRASSQHHTQSDRSPSGLGPDPKGFLSTHLVLPWANSWKGRMRTFQRTSM